MCFALRIYDITDDFNTVNYFDVHVFGYTDHWYLHIPASGREYSAEVGFKDKLGGFYPIARSNPITLPPERPCEDGVEQWTKIEL